LNIALLEDEPAQAELITTCLEAASYSCSHFSDGETYLSNVLNNPFDLLILDWNVPGLSGPEVLAKVRASLGTEVPVLFITSRSNEDDIVYALEHGADDYMIKPVKQYELVARIKALLRRISNNTEHQEHQQLDFKPYTFDTQNNVVTKNGETIKLTQKEYLVALALFQAAGQLVSRKKLLLDIWGHSAELQTRTVDTHISRIRTKLELTPKNGWRISSIYHHGYRLERTSTEEN